MATKKSESQEPEDLSAKVEELQELLKSKDEEIKVYVEENKRLEKMLESSEVSRKSQKPVLEHEGEKYVILGGAYFKGEKYNPERLQKSPEVVAHLIKIESSLLQKA